MNSVTFRVVRDTYRGLTTWGKWICPEGTTFESLEDCVRGWGIKDKGNTAIPATAQGSYYLMDITMSARFKREMIIIHTGDKVSLKNGGIEFRGIRAHGGNTHSDFEGCIGVARNRTATGIQGSAESDLLAKVKGYINNGIQVRLEVLNSRQIQ